MKYNHLSEQELFTPLRIATEKILSTAVSSQVKIDRLERMTELGRRNLLIRCWIEPIDNLPPSFIIKKVEGEYNRDRYDSADTKRLFNDWIGTQFLNTIALELQHSPKFYGGDRTLGLIVIEDVRHRHSLVESLLGSDPKATRKRNRSLAEWALLTTSDFPKQQLLLGNAHLSVAYSVTL